MIKLSIIYGKLVNIKTQYHKTLLLRLLLKLIKKKKDFIMNFNPKNGEITAQITISMYTL